MSGAVIEALWDLRVQGCQFLKTGGPGESRAARVICHEKLRPCSG